jgi:hypothetical protein
MIYNMIKKYKFFISFILCVLILGYLEFIIIYRIYIGEGLNTVLLVLSIIHTLYNFSVVILGIPLLLLMMYKKDLDIYLFRNVYLSLFYLILMWFFVQYFFGQI